MNHKQVKHWILVGIMGTVVLLVLAIEAQRPAIFSTLPFFAPTPTPTPISSENITVSQPYANAYVGKSFSIAGKARVFENVVTIRVSNKLSGLSYGEGTIQTDAQEAGTFGNFQTKVTLSDTSMAPGTKLLLEVFQASAKDGSEIDKVTIPLVFSPSGE